MAAPPAKLEQKGKLQTDGFNYSPAPNLNNDCAADTVLKALLTLLIVKEELQRMNDVSPAPPQERY